MRKLYVAAFFLLVAIIAGAQTPNFDYPYILSNDAGFIVEGNYYSNPAIGDWDDDGDFDLMVGIFYSGNIVYYENTSTGLTPIWGSGSFVQADGANIQVTYG
jgi:hypothetical protein